jgi:hypothetical protein
LLPQAGPKFPTIDSDELPAQITTFAKRLLIHSVGDVEVLASDSTQRRVCLMKPTYSTGTGVDWQDAVKRLSLEEKPLPNVLKVLNFLEFEQKHDCDVAQFWLTFAESVGFDASLRRDGINVMKLGAGHFVVAYYKADQRRVTLPPGFKQRYGLPVLRRGVTKIDLLDVFAVLEEVGEQQMGNVCCQEIENVLALDVVTTVRDMDPMRRKFERIQAQMTPAKDRTPLQNALCNAWATVHEVIDEQRAAKSRMEFPVHCEEWPTLKQYAPPGILGFTYAALSHLPVVYEYFDAATGTTKPTTLQQVITEFSASRAIIVSGPRFFGKTYFACALAKEMAVFHRDPDIPMDQLTFIFSTSVQGLEKCDLKEGKPIVLDDVDLGATMFWNASPNEFLKTAVDAGKSGTLRILGRVVYLPATPRIFTTNTPSLREFVKLREGGDIADEHFEAVARRVVFARVRSALYTPLQQGALEDKLREDREERVARMSALRSAGLW